MIASPSSNGGATASPSLDVLVVGDDDGARRALCEAVVTLGHHCRAAANRLEAWEMHEAKPADVILFSAQRVLSVYQALAERSAALRRDSQSAFQAARIDPLTEVPNRLRLKEDLEAVRSDAERYSHRYCVALCDIDEFKQYNDYYGHLAGDDVLRTIAKDLRQRLRQGDLLYRYGGDEFLIILPEQSINEAKLALERVRREIECLGIPLGSRRRAGDAAPSGAPRLLTISIGMAELDDPTDVNGWIQRADAALYQAKAKGKNCVEAAPERARPPQSLDVVR